VDKANFIVESKDVRHANKPVFKIQVFCVTRVDL
jgi:hypothetical protein